MLECVAMGEGVIGYVARGQRFAICYRMLC